MAFTYQQLVTGTRWKRAEILNAALRSETAQGTTAGAMFTNALFCILEHNFRRSPNKKKAILLWELFLYGNYPPKDKQQRQQLEYTRVFIPENAIWQTLFDMNIEGDGSKAVGKGQFRQIQYGMATLLAVFAQGQSLSPKNRKKTSHVRKFNIIGGQVSGNMFKPVADKVGPTVALIGTSGSTKDFNNQMCRLLYKNRMQAKAAIEKAGFNSSVCGLHKLTQ